MYMSTVGDEGLINKKEARSFKNKNKRKLEK